jgi:hypothetical protein
VSGNAGVQIILARLPGPLEEIMGLIQLTCAFSLHAGDAQLDNRVVGVES